MDRIAREEFEDPKAHGDKDQSPDEAQPQDGEAAGEGKGHGEGQHHPQQGEEGAHRGGLGGIDIRQQPTGDAEQKEQLSLTGPGPPQAMNSQGGEAAGGGGAIQMDSEIRHEILLLSML